MTLPDRTSDGVAVVTGATGGIGRWIARGLVETGMRVVLVGRDRQRAGQAASWIEETFPQAATDIEIADLSSLAETADLARRIVAHHPAVRILVNNAGMFSARRRETPEGHEQVLALNHLSPFVLTQGLLPSLHVAGYSGGARIVNIGSDTSDRARILPDDLEGRRRWGLVHTYAQSKLALMIATFGWSSRLQGSGIVANVVHPGAVATGLVRARGPIGLAWRLMTPFLLTEQQGAAVPLQVATAAEFAGVSGCYVKRGRTVQPNRRALDKQLAEKVWRATEALTGVTGPALPALPDPGAGSDPNLSGRAVRDSPAIVER